MLEQEAGKGEEADAFFRELDRDSDGGVDREEMDHHLTFLDSLPA